MDDVTRDFVAETYESLQSLEQVILTIEGDALHVESIRDAFRLLHTIKGTCGFLGFTRMQAVAHGAENVLSKMRDGTLIADARVTSTLFVALDTIRQIVDAIEAKGQESFGNDTDLLQALDACLQEKKDNLPYSENDSEDNLDEANLDEGGNALALEESSDPSTPSETAPQTLSENLSEASSLESSQTSQASGESKVSAPTTPSPAPESVPNAQAAKETQTSSTGGGIQSIRINLDVVDNLMALVGELVLTRNQLLQQQDVEQTTAQNNVLARLSHLTSDLQQNIMKTRMQAIENAWTKLPRIVRDISGQLGKKIQLKQIGADTELDRQVIELIKDPLVHMIRNSADHGIENPETRRASGKNEVGTIILKAYHHGGHIIIEIEDDGKGIDPDIIRAKALEKGVISASEMERMADDQALQLIFRAGFSTAETISNVSGRGVGMDVVRANIDKLGGTIEMFSKKGEGSRFVMKIPLTLSIISVLLVKVADQLFAVPQLAITEILGLRSTDTDALEYVKGVPLLRWRQKLLPLVYVSDLLQIQAKTDDEAVGEKPGTMIKKHNNHNIIIIQIGSSHFGFVVDSIHDSQEIVVKPLSKKLAHLSIFSGSTILGTGEVVLILDPNNFNLTVEAPRSSSDGMAMQNDHDLSKNTIILLFKVKDQVRAVPLALVARIDEITSKDIQYVGQKNLFLHRGELIPVMGYERENYEEDAPLPILIFADRGYKFALKIDEIIDIVEDSTEIQMESNEDATLGTAVINGEPITIIDCQAYFKKVYSNWSKTKGHRNVPKPQRRLLLVDDSTFFLNLISPLLKVSGYYVETALSADQGLKMATAATPAFDMIISDIEMPEKTGYDFLREIQSSETLASTPVIALSACDTEEEVQKAHAAGFKEFVPKTDQQNLIRVLNQLFG